MKLNIKKSHVLLTIVCLFMVTLCTHGFFRAFFGMGHIVDVFGIITIGSILFFNKLRFRTKESNPPLFWMFFVFAAGCLLVSVVCSVSLRHTVYGLRNYLMFILIGLLLSELNEIASYRKLLTLFSRIGAGVCLFAIVQFVFCDILPDSLLRFPGAGEEIVREGDTILFRVNGLFENSIVFGAFATIILVLLFSKIAIFGFHIIDTVCALITATSLALTFGRIAVIGAVVCCLFVFLIACRIKWRYKFAIMTTAATLGILFLIIFRDTPFVLRLLSLGGGADASDSRRMEMIREAWSVITDSFTNWAFGVGIGSQGYNRGDLAAVITDGSWLTTILELGFPTALILFASMISVLVYSFYHLIKTHSKLSRWANITCITLTFYFIFTGFINSSFTAVTSYGVYWCLMGLAVGINRMRRIPPYTKRPLPTDDVLMSVVIVSYKNRQVLVDCLHSIRDFNDIGNALEVIVVEQSPTDEIYDYLVAHHPEVHTIRAENRGFGAGNNRGAEAARGKYLLFLNPDTLLVEPIFRFACDKFEREEKTGLFGVRLLNADHSKGSSFESVVPFGFLRKLRLKFFEMRDTFLPSCMYIQGADLFVRRELFFEIGCFDEEIFMYCEETDLCTRVRRAGYNLAYESDLAIIHLQGACSSTNREGTFERQLKAFTYVSQKFGRDPVPYFRSELRLKKCKRLVYKLLRKTGCEGDKIAEADMHVLTAMLPPEHT